MQLVGQWNNLPLFVQFRDPFLGLAIRLLLLLFITICSTQSTWAQDWSSDSLKVVPNDKQQKRSQEFYDKLKLRMGFSWFTRELYNFLLDDDSLDYHAIEQLKIFQSEKQYEPYNGKQIGRVKLVPLEPFGTNIRDPEKQSSSELTSFINGVQINTRKSTLRRSLRLKSGLELNSYSLADAERILRATPFISEARMRIIPNPVDTNFVDVEVIMEESWTISLDYDSSPWTTEWEIYDGNFLGLGHRLGHRLVLPRRRFNVGGPDYHAGYEGNYRVYNAFNTLGDLSFIYQDTYRNQSGIAAFEKNFVSPQTIWGGGLHVSLHEFRDNHENPGNIIFRHKKNIQKFWLGRAFAVDDHGRQDFTRDRLIWAAAFERWDFTEGPRTGENFFRAYQSRQRYLMSLSFNKRNYYQASMIYGFGRTEDVPTGYLLQLTGGYEQRENTGRAYVGANVAMGDFLEGIGYMHADLKAGTFLGTNDQPEDSVLDLKINYFSNFSWVGRSQFRNFVELRYTQGSQRREDDYLQLVDKRGIRGLDLFDIIGDKRLTIKFENVLFTPVYIYGFQVAVMSFADFGWIARQDSDLTFASGSYQGFGFGFRLRNENLIFPTIQLRMGIYPRVPEGVNTYSLSLGGHKSLRVNDFVPGAPSILDFD